MKHSYVFIILLLIANNIAIFIFGAIQYYKANEFIRYTKINLLEHSALTIAKHTLDDVSFNDSFEQEIFYDKNKIQIFYKKTGKKFIIIDINIVKNNRNYFSSYLLNY